MSGADELDAALGDGAGGLGLEFGADFIDDDDFGHVVFDGFDHDGVLREWGGDLHAAGAADGGVWDVAVAADFVGGIDDDDALVRVIGEDAGDFAKHGCFADAGLAQEEDALAPEDEVFDDADGAVDGAADAAGEAHDLASPVADAADAVEGALDAGAVVIAEVTDVLDDELEVLFRHFFVAEHDFAAGVARLGQTAEIHDDLEQVGPAFGRAQSFDDARWESIEQEVEVVGDDLFVREDGRGGGRCG